jgi:hypothetical protein
MAYWAKFDQNNIITRIIVEDNDDLNGGKQ